MTQTIFFTDKYINDLKPEPSPYKRTEKAAKGEGRLMIRVLPGGIKEFFYRYRANGGDKTLALGRYDPTGVKGKTLKEIRKVLNERRELQRSTGDVKEHLATNRRKKDIEKRKGTLSQLLDAYVQSLRHAGKISADEAEGIFKRHVTGAFPSLGGTKAKEIEPGDIQRILAKMVRAKITRQVNKARSYLAAAFAYGMAADYDPRTTARDGVLFGLKANPVAGIKRIKEFENTSDRALSEDELREFWNGLEALPLVQRQALRFNLALAGQRPTQLLRAGWEHFDLDANTLLLRDSKGRGNPRDHLLPLTEFALEQLEPLREINSRASTPFTSDGKRAMVVETLSVCVADVSKALRKEMKIPAFGQRDLRRTVETMLQKLGVDREVRAHLLSHGRGEGVQGKHYERYDFLPEKRQALERWAAHLQRMIENKPQTKVTPIKRAAA